MNPDEEPAIELRVLGAHGAFHLLPRQVDHVLNLHVSHAAIYRFSGRESRMRSHLHRGGSGRAAAGYRFRRAASDTPSNRPAVGTPSQSQSVGARSTDLTESEIHAEPMPGPMKKSGTCVSYV